MVRRGRIAGQGDRKNRELMGRREVEEQRDREVMEG